jgi:hypothetical protein
LSQAQVTNLGTDLAAKVATTRQVIAGTGMGGGGALSADVTLNVSYGTSGTTACVGNDARLSNDRTPSTHASTHGSAGSDAITIAQSQVTSLVSALAAKALGATTMTAGTGLTGGGDLSANRSFAVAYGTTSTTATVGDDSRLSFTAAGTGATARTLQNKLRDVISVKDFGAVGDGSTDDTAAIQAALTAAATSSGSVYIPATTNSYKITDALTVPDEVSVFGEGYGSCIQLFTAERNLLICGNVSTVKNLRLKMPSGFPLSDITLQNAIYISAKSGVTVQDNWIELVDAQSGINAYQSRNVIITGNIIYGANWNPATNGAAASAADILIWGSDPTVVLQLSRYTIANNFCFSNSSQGIYVDQLGSNTEIIVQSNQCVTLDPATCVPGGTWLEIASGTLKRRHGIVMGYNANTVNGPRAIIANNICRNTNWTGIYVQTGGGGTATLTPGPVLVTGNLCSKNALDATETSGLTGGIWFSNRNSNTVVTGNVIDEMQHVTSGGITYFPGALSTTGPTISNNYVLSSLGYGILLTGYAANTNIVGNTIVDTAINDISHVAVGGQPDVGGLLIEGNTLKRTNFAAESILLNQVDGTVVSTVRNNYIKGHDKNTGGSVVATATEKNAGIKTNRNLYVRMTGNIVDNFHVAIAFSGYWADGTTSAARYFDADLNNNTIRNCLNGFGIASTGNNAVVPVTGNVFDGVTNNISATYGNGSPGGSLAGYVARKDNTRIVVLDRNAAPTNGNWAIGDRVEYTTPTAGGFLGAVCVVAGNPGTWKTFGAVTA